MPRSAKDIEAAVEEYLAERTDLQFDRLEVRADRIRYGDDAAVAEVSIVAVDDPEAAMKMTYALRQAEGGWEVVPVDSRGEPAAPLQPGQGSGEDLPPGHPPVSPQTSPLPPGHPPLDRQGQ